jgi:hypothetical protein
MGRKFAVLGLGVCVTMLCMGIATASASDTRDYTFKGQSSGDSSTCGPDWANDTYTRVFKIYPERNIDGSYRMIEYFTDGHFVTIQGPSPESCEAADSNTVSPNLHGSFHGNETIKVINGTFSPSGARHWDRNGGTDGFIAAAFGAGATNGATDDYWFKYTTSNSAACAKKWIDASTGDSGDIATFCAS